ncbi:Oxidoreductase ucpA [Diplodia seriata]|uniref:Oxidoreductase ucpA n=1 Tax=Diplodia seriata TaxID=420778 RepID=A0A1S8BM32_9PEZI|nr:Oxidoreductase ucpA [Diplodia seriata]
MSSDPRVAALDAFTPTTHSRPSPTLLSAVHNDTPNATASLSTVLILGASRGIGAATAHVFARAGATHLILASTASSTPALASVAAAIRRSNAACRVDVRECDVADAANVEAMAAYVECVIDAGGRLDAVVLNAGYSGDVELRVTGGGTADVGQWERAFAVNAVGTYLVARFFVPLLLREERGRKALLVVGSIAAGIRRGVIANTKYCVSKMAQVRVVEHVAEQFGAQGLLAVAVHPGAVETAMAVETAPEAFMKYLVDDPELCGHFLVWLTRVPGQFQWLNGRLVSATWDPDELLAKKDEIVAKDLLKFEVRTE